MKKYRNTLKKYRNTLKKTRNIFKKYKNTLKKRKNVKKRRNTLKKRKNRFAKGVNKDDCNKYFEILGLNTKDDIIIEDIKKQFAIKDIIISKDYTPFSKKRSKKLQRIRKKI